MKKLFGPTLACALVLGTLAVASAPASADVSDVDVNGDLASALDLPAGVAVSTAATSTQMIGTSAKAFNDFPSRRGDGAFAVLSTGKATDLFNWDNLDGRQPSTNFGGSLDKAAIILNVAAGATAPSGDVARCLLVDVAMGTEERVHYLTSSEPGDEATLRLNHSNTEYAMQIGPRFFGQEDTPLAPVRYTVNALNYWHGIDREFERQPDDSSAPLLPAITPFDNFTSVDTLEVPLNANDVAVAAAGESGDEVTLSVADAYNNSLDTVLLVDRVRLAPYCSTHAPAETGLFASRKFEIVGHRGVNNQLSIDLLPQTDQIERYDAADNGWFPAGGVDLRFRWYRSKTSSNCTSSDMSNWIAIADADRQTFTPSVAEKGKCILALVTGLKDGYRAETFPSPGSSEWSATLAIQDGVFTVHDTPTITKLGNPNVIKVNDVLTATNGKFTPLPDSYSYQWYAGDTAISGETGQTLKVTASQAGKTIRVRVTASRLNFDSMSVSSLTTNPVDLMELETTPTPTILGSGRVGETLNVDTGTWQPDPVGLSYQWYLDGSVITGQTKATFTPTASQEGRQITVYVTGRKTGYLSVTKQSTPVIVTIQGFVQAPTPVIEGSGFAGDTLTALAGTWNPVITPSYQWYADNIAISGATKSTFTPTESQDGLQLHVVVTGAKAGYETTSRQSAPISVRLRSYDASPDPSFDGDPYVGSKLTVNTGVWSPAPTKFTYEWYADGVRLSTTSNSLTLTETHRGKFIAVKVAPVKDFYEKLTRTSAPVGVQIRSFIASGPTISGTPKVGSTLTAGAGTWLPTPSLKYEWFLGSASLGKSTRLVVPPAAAGKKVRLVVTGSKAYYQTLATSEESGTIAAGTIVSASPRVTGRAKVGATLRVSAGSWRPSPVTLRYQWYVGSTAIKGATKSSYKVPTKYKGKKIRVRVNGSKAGYTAVNKYSSYTKKVAKK